MSSRLLAAESFVVSNERADTQHILDCQFSEFIRESITAWRFTGAIIYDARAAAYVHDLVIS